MSVCVGVCIPSLHVCMRAPHCSSAAIDIKLSWFDKLLSTVDQQPASNYGSTVNICTGLDLLTFLLTVLVSAPAPHQGGGSPTRSYWRQWALAGTVEPVCNKPPPAIERLATCVRAYSRVFSVSGFVRKK